MFNGGKFKQIILVVRQVASSDFQADASLELILNIRQEAVLFLNFYVHGAALTRLDSRLAEAPAKRAARLAGGTTWHKVIDLICSKSTSTN